MGEFSILHWLVVLIVILVVFGPKRLPEIGAAIGKAIKEFKRATQDAAENVKEVGKDDDKKST